MGDGSKEKEKEMKENIANTKESGKKTALASLSDSDDDIPPAVNAPVSDSDSGPDEVKKPKKEHQEKAEKEKVEKEKADQEKADKVVNKKKVNEETFDQEKAEEKISEEAKGDSIPTRNALAALSDSDDDFPAPVGADDSDKEGVEEGKSMEEKLKQKLREKEA